MEWWEDEQLAKRMIEDLAEEIRIDKPLPHVTELIYCLTRSWYNRKRSDLPPTPRETMLFVVGVGLEQVMLKKHRQHIGGIFEGIHYDIDFLDYDSETGEFKSTRISGSKFLERMPVTWVKQVLSYVKIRGATTITLPVMHLMGSYCLAPSTRILTSSLEWNPLSSVSIGDKIFGVDEEAKQVRGGRRRLRISEVTNIGPVILPSFKLYLEDGRTVVSSGTHKWLARRFPSHNSVQWADTDSLREGSELRQLCAPWEFFPDYEAGYASGILDGEGSVEPVRFRVSVAQKHGVVLDRFKLWASCNGVPMSESSNEAGVVQLRTTRLADSLRLLGLTKPSRLMEKLDLLNGRGLPAVSSGVSVIGVDYLGNTELIGIQTSTGTLIAEGLISHNSPPFPELRVWRGRFTQEEVDDNWAWMQMRKEIYLDHIERDEAPKQFTYNEEWECDNCAYKLLCDARQSMEGD